MANKTLHIVSLQSLGFILFMGYHLWRKGVRTVLISWLSGPADKHKRLDDFREEEFTATLARNLKAIVRVNQNIGHTRPGYEPTTSHEDSDDTTDGGKAGEERGREGLLNAAT
ncbi:hypothetical protein EV127DRAFT_403844 [Xylaria flabelliformis]|nr:hypothetical protein EV127DRAFT_403844 [Xylaria flabelliformis]